MKQIVIVLAVVVLAATGASAAGAGQVPGARPFKACAAAGDFWPTMTLALDGPSAWVACKEQGRVVRVDTRTGKTLKSVRLGDLTIAVASGFRSIWALGSSGTLYRLSAPSGKLVKQIRLPVAAAYNIWLGGGSVWVADDRGAKVVRVSPKTNRVVAQVPAGNGPADMAFSGTTAWVMNHRDRVLTRVHLRTNRSAPLATLGEENVAPERMVWAGGKLWITGRGADLYEVDPANGSIEATIEIGASGIDIAVDGDALVIPTRSAESDVRGFPSMNAVVRVSVSTGAVTTLARPVGRVDVHGLVARTGFAWLADNTGGRLYRVALGG